MSPPSQRLDAPAETTRWPTRLIALAMTCRDTPDDKARRAALGELWTLVHLGLARFVRGHASRLGSIGNDDVRDIAAEKALSLMRKLEVGEWTPASFDPAQLCAFLSTLARNGLVDHLRRAEAARIRSRQVVTAAGEPEPRPHEAPSRALYRILFSRALVDCLGPLSARSRRIWLLRTFHDLPSKAISRHPAVRVSPAAVDMTLARVRAALRRCMRRKGFDVGELPRGTFVAAWEAIERAASEGRVGE